MNTIFKIASLASLIALAGCASSLADDPGYEGMSKRPVRSKHFTEQFEPTISIKPLSAAEQEAKERTANRGKISIVPLAANAAPAAASSGASASPSESNKLPIAVQPIWTLTAGNTIGQDLGTWAKKAGWNLIWNMRQDWSVPASSTFTGDFRTAATTVINTLAANGALIRAQFYDGNKTLVVTGPGVAAQ